VDYLIQREDRGQLHVEVRCWDKARDAAERAGNAAALKEAMADRDVAVALECSELAESLAARGAVTISMWFDPADKGSLRQQVSYERTGE
jgi:hypothetical protein